MTRLKRASAVMGVCVGVSAICANAAIFEGLGFLPGTDHSMPKAVSGDGSVVVGVSADARGLAGLIGGNAEAFRWTTSGGMQGLGDFPGGINFSVATGISKDGSVIAGGSDSDAGTQSFRWTSASGMVQLVPPPPYTSGGAFAISRDGSAVVGRNFIGGVGGGQPYRWTAATGEVPLGILPGYDDLLPRGVSGDGSVVVGDAVNSGHNTGHVAFRWTAANGIQALPMPAGSSAEAHVISADGHVIAGYLADFQSSKPFAGLVIWHDGGTFQEIQGLRTPANVQVGGITSDGSIIVGNIPPVTASGPTHAFIWDAADGMRDLNLVLPEEYGIDLQGWLLNSADGISDDGRVIAGYGTNPQGQMEAWVVVLPEPSCVALMIPGVLLVRRRKWVCRH